MTVQNFRRKLRSAIPSTTSVAVIWFDHPDQPWDSDLASIEIRVGDQEWICQAVDLDESLIDQILADVGIAQRMG